MQTYDIGELKITKQINLEVSLKNLLILENIAFDLTSFRFNLLDLVNQSG